MAQVKVFTARTTNGNSSEVGIKPGFQGVIAVLADGTFDSGVLKLQINADETGGTWIDADTQTLSANGVINVPVYGANRVRVNLASVAAASALLDVFLEIPDAMTRPIQTDN